MPPDLDGPVLCDIYAALTGIQPVTLVDGRKVCLPCDTNGIRDLAAVAWSFLCAKIKR